MKRTTTYILALLTLLNAPLAADMGLKLKISTANDPVTVTVSGRITDRQTGIPLAQARVRGHMVTNYDFETCPTAEATTDADGMYELVFNTPLATGGPRAGKNSLCVYADAPGYACLPFYVKPWVTPDHLEFLDVDLALTEGKQLLGTLVGPRKHPIANARIRIQNGMNGDWNFFGSLGETYSNELGEFELWIDNSIRSMLGKNPWLCIQKEGEGVRFVWGIRKQEDLGLVSLPPGGSLSGQINDGQGLPLAGCQVSARVWPCDLVVQSTTDTEGKYHLQGIPSNTAIRNFYQRKNGRVSDDRGKVTVYARLDQDTPLRNAANYQIRIREGESLIGPDLTVGQARSASGKIIGKVTGKVTGNVLYSLGGLKIRLDTDWDQMVETDLEGRFAFPHVASGPHRLTAYLPHNLRYDRGIGRIEINVPADQALEDVTIQLENLAQCRVQYLDMKGDPLADITSGATWSKSGNGGWTEGTVSDSQGWAVLYLYAGQTQYVRGYHQPGTLVTEMPVTVQPLLGQILDPIQIVMVPAATLIGQLIQDNDAPLAQARIQCRLSYADGHEGHHGTHTDAAGKFEIAHITPGICSLTIETEQHTYLDVLEGKLEVAPGQHLDLGSLQLTASRTAHARLEKIFDEVVAAPQQLRVQADKLLNDIRNADYTNSQQWKTNRDAWKDFIDYEYCVYTNYPGWVKWICEHFQDNPITQVNWGAVTRSNKKGFWKGHTNVPSIAYQFTLQDGKRLTGTLLFDYHPEKDLWMGLHGLDWHLKK